MMKNALKRFSRDSFKTVLRILPRYSLIINNKMTFTTDAKPDEEDSHSDFKPKSKNVITDENVMKMIDDWVKGNKVCLFMKGVPQMPQCGFSNYLVQVLKFYDIKNYKAVNVLENATLREAVKKYSNWPTYPQLYVNGNLIGSVIL